MTVYEPAQFSFPGLTGFVQGTMAFSGLGIAPSVANLEYPIQPIPQRIGNLSIYDPMTNKSIVFQNAVVVDVKIRKLSDGTEVMNVSIADRRWFWTRCESITGHYNIRGADQKVTKDSEHTPFYLAYRCLGPMGETDSVDAAKVLPEDARPEVNWKGSNPARALEQLCDDLGYVVVYNHITNGVEFHQTGIGQQLPPGGGFQPEYAFDPPEIPSKITVLCGPSLGQGIFELEAVGKDFSGEYVPIDQLTYAPDKTVKHDRWSKENPDYFVGIEDKETRDMALADVFRRYRIKYTLDGLRGEPGKERTLFDCGSFMLTFRRRSVLLQDKLIGYKYNEIDSYRPNSYVFGHHYDYGLTYKNEYKNVNASFSIDQENQCIVFERPVYTLLKRGGYNEPILYLVAGCEIFDTFGGYKKHASVYRNISYGVPGVEEVLQHPEISYQVATNFNKNLLEKSPSKQKPEYNYKDFSNEEEVERECNQYIDAKIASYHPIEAVSDVYPSIMTIPCDGAIRQLVFSISKDGTTKTQISRNTESDPYTPDYRERKRQAYASQQAQQELARKNASIASNAAKDLGRFR